MEDAIKKLKAINIEIALANYFNIRRNLIVPNVSWGFRHRNYETDLVIVTPSGYAYEVEIKISKSDLIRDKLKHKWKLKKYHQDYRKSFFAIPHYLLEYKQHIPDFAGIITVRRCGRGYSTLLERNSEINTIAKQITEKERYQLARLGALRIWGLKKKIVKLEEK